MKKAKNKHGTGAEVRMDVLTAFVLFGLIFVRYCYYGLVYYEQLDDYVQYGKRTLLSVAALKDLWNGGAFSARPLAGVFDCFVWSRFSGNLLAAVAVISALYAASAVLLHGVFRRRFGTGSFFYIVYALLPLGFEGTYWLSASSRIAVGLFFAALSLFFFDRWCGKGKKASLALFAVFQFIAFCFYEQVVLFSAAATLTVMLAVPKSERHRAHGGWLFLAGGLLYFAVIKTAPAGVNGARTVLYLPWQEGWSAQVAQPLGHQLRTAFLDGGSAALGSGLLRGFALFRAGPDYIYLLFVLALCFSFYVAARYERRTSVRFFAELLAGAFLAAAPLAVFFILRTPWFGLRNTVTSYCGLALMADALADLVFGRWRGGAKAGAATAAILAGLCCISSISELHTYRALTAADTQICQAAASAITDLRAPSDSRRGVLLLNLEPGYPDEGSFVYHEHGCGVTSSVWAMTSATAAIAKRPAVATCFTLRPVTPWQPFAADDAEIERQTVFWFDGLGFSRVSLTPGASGWLVTDAESQTLATLARNANGAVVLTAK